MSGVPVSGVPGGAGEHAPRALVAGASSDIGAAIAVDLASLGHDLLLWGRDQARLDSAADRCRTLGRTAVTSAFDVRDADKIRAEVDDAAAGGELAVVVWAAGVFDWAPADGASPTAWEEVLGVNLTAAAVATACVLPHLVAAAPSALVYLGSGASRTAYANNAAYVASKHGLLGLAGGTFLDVRDRGVKVSTVSPGLVAAGAGLGAGADPAALLAPEDVAAAVRFVVTFPERGCPTEIALQPQRSP